MRCHDTCGSPRRIAAVKHFAFFCCVLFGLELTVGNSWAHVTLDIGGIYAGSVSAVMNFVGNAAASGFTAATGYILVAL